MKLPSFAASAAPCGHSMSQARNASASSGPRPSARLFDERDPGHIERERTRTLEGEHGVVHMRYRVQR